LHLRISIKKNPALDTYMIYVEGAGYFYLRASFKNRSEHGIAVRNLSYLLFMRKYLWIIIIMLFMAFLLAYLWQNLDHQTEQIKEPSVALYLHEKNEVISLAMENYIIGTVAAEMPASFEMEALKAQAVCARTYALKKLIDQHPYPRGADLSDDINSCQAFRDLFSSDQAISDSALARVKMAVKATRGEIILYQSRPIDALYYSCCGGKTDRSWGNAPGLDYLKVVTCRYCKASPHYLETRQVLNSTLAALVGSHDKNLDIQILSTSPGGRANQISINGKKIWASDLRQKLGLPSQWLSFHQGHQQTAITTRGYGHGLGLCQYGANGMAKQGKSYQQILNYYYKDIELYKLPY